MLHDTWVDGKYVEWKKDAKEIDIHNLEKMCKGVLFAVLMQPGKLCHAIIKLTQ